MRGLCQFESKARLSVMDSKLKVWDILKSVLVNNRVATETDIMDKSPVLQLLTVQENKMRRIEEVFKENNDGDDSGLMPVIPN